MTKQKGNGKSAGAPKAAEFTGSPTSQRRVKERWRLESQLKNCRANIGLWEGKLATATAGVKRWSEQLSLGTGAAHSILISFTKDVEEAERMIAAFKQNVVNLETEIAALELIPEQAAQRAEGQGILAALALARLEGDKQIDATLSVVIALLCERQQVTAKMRERAMALEFDRDINLDDMRFDALLRALPKEMARESGKWVEWFLGREADRRPSKITGGQVTLPETLRSHNAFQIDDCPELTAAEEKRIRDIVDACFRRDHPQPPAEESPRIPGAPVPEVPPEKIQWGIIR
jgi:hypothetical protein